MAQRTVTIASSVGLHARPAALFVEAVNETGLDVEIGRPGDDAVDASSILGVMDDRRAGSTRSRDPARDRGEPRDGLRTGRPGGAARGRARGGSGTC